MQRASRFTLPLLAIVAGASLASAGIATAQANLCSLFTRAEMEKFAGQKMLVGDDGEVTSLAGGTGSACSWAEIGAQVIVFTGAKSSESFDNYVKSWKVQNTTRHPIPEVGPGAYIMFPKPRSQYEDTVAVVVVTRGDRTLGISLAAPTGKTQESMQPAVIAFAKEVLKRLK
jgi:hypothetical protein